MTVGIDLLAAIRRHKSRAALHELHDELFTDAERPVYHFLRDYVAEHHQFPAPQTVRRETSVTLPKTVEPHTYYLRDVRNRALYNSIRDPFTRLADALQSTGRPDMGEAIDAIQAMHAASTRFVGSGSGIETSASVIERVRAEFHEAQLNHDLRGVTSGWAEVDEATLGYQAEDLITWVGRPGRGKSWLLIKQAYAAWRAGHRVLFISMEMSAEAIMRRMVGLHSRINPHLIRAGLVQTLAVPLVEAAFREMQEVNPIDICTANFNRSVDQIQAFVERYMPDIIFVDASYLLTPQKKRFGSSGRRETISDTTEEMKQLASNAHRPVVQTVQFNRTAEQRRRGAHNRSEGGDGDGEQRRGPVNPIAHLGLDVIGETDVISQASSHVFGIDLPPMYQREMRVFGFLKGREGEDGFWYCNYPPTRLAPINLDIVRPDDPRIIAINDNRDDEGPRRRQRPGSGERTNLSFMRHPGGSQNAA